MRSEFEKAYEPNPHKSPFTEVRFNEEKQIYEPLNPPLDRVARSLNAAWYGYRIRQTEVDELKLQVAEMKSRLNDAYTDGQSAMYVARQSKVDELRKRLDAALQEIKGATRWVDEDAIDDPDFIKGGVLRAFARLEQTLKGEQP